jgi:hypothetical protein
MSRTQSQRWRDRAKGHPSYRMIRFADLCGCPHKSAYAEFRVMPRYCSLGANLPAQRNIGLSVARHNSRRPGDADSSPSRRVQRGTAAAPRRWREDPSRWRRGAGHAYGPHAVWRRLTVGRAPSRTLGRQSSRASCRGARLCRAFRARDSFNAATPASTRHNSGLGISGRLRGAGARHRSPSPRDQGADGRVYAGADALDALARENARHPRRRRL